MECLGCLERVRGAREAEDLSRSGVLLVLYLISVLFKTVCCTKGSCRSHCPDGLDFLSSMSVCSRSSLWKLDGNETRMVRLLYRR